jgi:hypothetical protein
MSTKRKLLVVAGAGSSIECGMPSVWKVGDMLRQGAQENFTLAETPTQNLYGYLHDAVARYWREKLLRDPDPKEPNFEDILYVISALAATYPAGIYTSALGAFMLPPGLPDILQFEKRIPTDANVIRYLAQHLVDYLLADFRQRCGNPDPMFAANRADFQGFFAELRKEFDIAVVSLNYDNLIHNALPDLETGFDTPGGGQFSSDRIIARNSWPCLLHLHGSVHFDMRVVGKDLHRIFWESDLANCQQNSFGRGPRYSVEGNQYPTSSIVAGYGKTFQLLKAPFHTYYSELDRLVHTSDAALFVGYGFGDAHLNAAFSDYFALRDRPVVVIDYASDNTFTAGSSFYEGSPAAKHAMSLFEIAPHQLSWLGYTFPETVAQLRAAKAFEICRDPGSRLSLWYNGMLEACRHPEKVIEELNQNELIA